ncbi:MAG: hydrogenase iron-sulfur subunit, partial [Thermodesulfovibrionales bacterium]|nr:hydrogenase iron-sulfur subunit [Thermodesulfovibrionales bacterium]
SSAASDVYKRQIVDSAKCMACLTCKRVCPYDAPVVKAYSEIRPQYCQACGLCVSECPAQAISMASYNVREIRDNMAITVGNVNPNRSLPIVVIFYCTSYIGLKDFEIPQNIRLVPMTCLSRLDVLDIIKAFECGADGVMLLKCQKDTCKYETVDKRVALRVLNAKEILKVLSINDKSLEVFTLDNANEIKDLLSRFTEKIEIRR